MGAMTRLFEPVDIADGKPVVFLYVGDPKPARTPRMFEVIDPYLDDAKAKEYFSKAENLAQRAKIQRRFVYRQQTPDTLARVWHVIRPRDTVIAADQATQLADVSPDRVRYEITSAGESGSFAQNVVVRFCPDFFACISANVSRLK